MKALLSSLTLCLIVPLISSAQTQKGQWTVGAQIGNFSYQNQNGSRIITTSITPSAGYFIANGLALGTGIPTSTTSQKSTIGIPFYRYDFIASSIGLAPFIRYFVGEKKLKPYLGLAFSYSRSSNRSARTDPSGIFQSEGKGETTAFVPTLGLAYFVSQNLGLTAGLNYNINHENQTSTNSYPTNPMTTSTYDSDYKSLSLAVGFQLFIGK